MKAKLGVRADNIYIIKVKITYVLQKNCAFNVQEKKFF